MNYIKSDYAKYIRKMDHKDYSFIDPPWLLDDSPPKVMGQLDYLLWHDNSLLLPLLGNIDTDVIFLWTIVAILDEVFNLISRQNRFVYKTKVEWVKLTKNKKIHFGTGHWFRNSTECLLVLAKPDIKPIRLQFRNVCFAESSKVKTKKPKKFERKIMNKLLDKKGCYIFCGNDVSKFRDFDIECIDILNKKEVIL